MKKLLACLLVLFMLVGCSSNSTSETTADTTAAETTKSVTIASDTDIESMDTSIATDGTSFIAQTLCMAGLTQLDGEGNAYPDLAKSWDISDDNLVYTFHLQEGAKWSNGTAITANDFVYAWNRLIDPETASEYAFLIDTNADSNTANVVKWEATDDSTFVVTLSIPCDFFLSLCAFPPLFAINEEFCEAQGDQYALTTDNLIYSGPYTMDSWTVGDSYSFVKNENYWDAASYTGNVDTINFKLIQGQSAILDYEAGNIDYVKLTSEVIDDYAGREDTTSYLSGYAWFLSMNFHNEYMANEKVREAIAYAVNTTEMCDTVLKDGSAALSGIVTENTTMSSFGKEYRDFAGTKVVGYDLEKAKSLVEEAKKELGVDSIEFELLYEDSDVTKNVSQYVMKCLEDAGFTVTAKCEPKKSRIEDMRNDNYDIAVHRWGPDYADPQSYIDLFLTGASNNYGHYESADYDALVNKALSGEDSAEERWTDFSTAETMLIAQDFAVVPLYQAGNTALQNTKLSGIEYHGAGVDNYRHMVLAD